MSFTPHLFHRDKRKEILVIMHAYFCAKHSYIRVDRSLPADVRGRWKRKEKGSGLWSTPFAARAPRNVSAKQCIVVQYSTTEYELAFRLRVDDMAATCML